jgi:hypothetical protein
VTTKDDQLPRGNRRLAGRQEHSVGRPKCRAPDLASQDCQLVPKDDHLQILRLRRPKPKHQQLQDALKRDIKKEQKHGTSANTTRGPLF